MRRPMVGNAKQNLILDKAGALFARFGLKKTSMDEVARDAAVSKATLYDFCKSKEHLYVQVLHHQTAMWLEEVDRAIDESLPAPRILAAISKVAFEFLDRHPLLQSFYTRETQLLLPNWLAELAALREEALKRIARVLALGVKQGVFRKNLSVPLAASLLDDLQLAGYLHHWKDLTQKGRIDRLSGALDILLHGFLSASSDGSGKRPE